MDHRGYHLSEVARVVGGEHIGTTDPVIDQLVIDSRRSRSHEGSLFIALKGERHDGHSFIPELIARGFRNFLVQEIPDAPKDVAFVLVHDTLEAMQRLTTWHRGHFNVPVIGITGSNGKTIVKEWLAQMLMDQVFLVRSPGSWNSQVGVPLSVWNMSAHHGMGVFEAGISKPGEMERLRPIIAPTIGIFTNLGPAHDTGFSSAAEKAREKLKLFSQVGALVYCSDHERVHEAVIESGIGSRSLIRDWSREHSAFVRVVNEQRSASGTQLKVLHGTQESLFELPFQDHASIENALHCITLLLHLGHVPEWIAERLARLTPVAMRLEMMQGVHGSTLINDAYSNDTASLAVALDHLMALSGGRNRVVVLSDIDGSGEEPKRLYERVSKLLDRAHVGHAHLVGPGAAEHSSAFRIPISTYASTEELIDTLPPETFRDAIVLVKGARRFALEKAVARWQEHVHGTVLEVDLEAIKHNLDHYRSRLGPGVGIIAMVKAFGYGTGAVELARLFAFERVAMLGVAYADEGIALRQAGIDLPILVMNPEPVPFDLLHRFRLEAVVYDAASLRAAIAHGEARSEAPPVHVKIDTGMHRLGFTAEELPQLIELLLHAPQLRVGSVFSHLAASEDAAHDDFTRGQITRFISAADRIDAVLDHRPKRHLANSGGITRFPEAHFDLVRPGIGLHGVGVDAEESALLRPAATLRTVIAQVKVVTAGSSVGYGRRHRTTSMQRLAVLPIGYADGLLRALGHGAGRVWIDGKAAPFVGSICMDMCMVDLGDIPAAPGDPVVVFGPEHPVQDYAKDLGTIPYEALTLISQRVKRVFVRE